MTPGDRITDMVNERRIEEVPEDAVSAASVLVSDQMLTSIAISLKRIADSLEQVEISGEPVGDLLRGMA